MNNRNPSNPADQSAVEDWRQVIEAFVQTIWEADAAGQIVGDSPSWRAYTGQNVQQWLSEGWIAAVHPDDRHYALNQWQQALYNQAILNAEIRFKNVDGGWRWANVRATPVRNPDGSIRKWIGLTTEVAERKRVDAAFLQSEERFRAFVTATSDVVYQMGADWREMHQLAGKSFLSDTQTTSTSWLEQYIPREDQALVQTAIDRAIREKRPFELAHRVIRADGSLGWTFSRAIPILDEAGQIQQWLGAARDITDSKRTEEALHRHHLWLTMAMQSARAGWVIWDLYSGDVEWSAEGKAIIGFSAEQEARTVEGWLQRIHPDDRPKVKAEAAQAVAERRDFQCEYRVVHDSGKVHWLLGTGRMAFEPNGTAYRSTGLVLDITGRKQGEEALRQSEARYRTLFNSIDEGFNAIEVLFDKQKKPVDGRVLEVNPAYLKMTGLSPDVVGRRLREFIPGIEDRVIERYGRVVQTGEPARFEEYISTLDRWFDCYALRLGGESSHTIAVIFNNTTGRKRRETNLAFLAEVSQDLAHLTNIEATMAVLGEKIGRFFGVRQCLFAEYTDAYETPAVSYGWNAQDAPSLKGTYRIHDFLSDELMRAVMVGEPVVVNETQADARVSTERYGALTIRSFIIVPLVREGEWRFQLSIIDNRPRQWQADQIELIGELTNRIWTRLERARSENALKESERFVQGVIHSLPVVIYIFDLVTGQNRYLSPQVVELLGYTPEQMQAEGPELIPTFFHPDDQPRLAAHFERIRTEQPNAEQYPGIFSIEYRINHRERGWVWVQSRDTVYARDAGGKPTLLLGTVEDISRRRTDAQALQESEKRLRLAIEATELGTWEWNLDTNEVYWNEQHFRLFGMQPLPQPLTPDVFMNHVHPAERDRVRHLLQKAIAERGVYDAEFCAILDDGSQRWMSGYGRIVEERDGEPLRMSGVMFDVNERRRAQDALRQSEALRRAILNSAKDYAIFTTDLDRCVTSWNRGAQAVFGYSEAQIMHQSADQLFTSEDRQQGAPQHEAQTAAGQGEAESERWHSRQDGSRFYGSGVVTPLRNEDGSMLGLLKVMRDLTTQKRAEEALQQASQRKDEFLAMLAHELRNPMATVRNGLGILALTSEPDTMTGQTVAMMSRQVDHLVHMVDDLLDVSRISQGKIQLKRERVDLGALVVGAVDAIRPHYETHQKQIQLTPWPSALFMDGDATRLSQIVTNLLTNGLRYTGEGGKVGITVERVDNQARLRVADNGIGLTPEQLEVIFELFVQVDHSLARQQGGLGVGLTLVKRLVELHGGRVEAHSPGLGRGSEFVVYLPLLEEHKPERTVTTTTASTSPKQGILVIDDNADAALTLSMLLKLKGYQVHYRYSGRLGLQAAEELRPAVILCDIGMPELDGYETARLLRQQPWGQSIILIALTGYGGEEDKQRAREAGFNGHLVKPVDINALTALLTELLAAT